MANHDELMLQMERDELEDEAAQVDAKLPVRRYAQLRNMAPQLVYYYIREGHLKPERCICGAKVLDVATADAFFKDKADKKKAVQHGE
jgi:hypothetical protein